MTWIQFIDCNGEEDVYEDGNWEDNGVASADMEMQLLTPKAKSIYKLF